MPVVPCKMWQICKIILPEFCQNEGGQFYFKRYGDNQLASARLGRAWRNGEKDLDINTCVLHNHTECSEVKLWYVVPYFCGQAPICREPGRDALLRAKRHVLDNFLVVGVLEDFDGMLKVLEKVLPNYFQGASHVWKKIQDRTVMKTATRIKEPLSPEAYAVLRKRMKLDYDFYDFVVRLFKQLKEFQLGLE